MAPENKQNRRYKEINFIGFQNYPLIWRLRAPDQGGLLYFPARRES
jgi:hypothetical protein